MSCAVESEGPSKKKTKPEECIKSMEKHYFHM